MQTVAIDTVVSYPVMEAFYTIQAFRERDTTREKQLISLGLEVVMLAAFGAM
jgi:hypothetical protein